MGHGKIPNCPPREVTCTIPLPVRPPVRPSACEYTQVLKIGQPFEPQVWLFISIFIVIFTLFYYAIEWSLNPEDFPKGGAISVCFFARP